MLVDLLEKKIMIKNKNVIALVSSSRPFSIKVDLNMEQEAPSKIWKEKKKPSSNINFLVKESMHKRGACRKS